MFKQIPIITLHSIKQLVFKTNMDCDVYEASTKRLEPCVIYTKVSLQSVNVMQMVHVVITPL